MAILVFLFLFVIFAVILTLVYSSASNHQYAQEHIELKNCPEGFMPSHVHLDKYGGSGIALDQQNRQLCLVMPDSQAMKVIPYKDLCGSLALQDSVPIARTLRQAEDIQPFLKTIVGSDQEEKQEISAPEHKRSATVSSIDLQVIIKDDAMPVHTVSFLNMEAKVGGFIYNAAVEKAGMWQELMAHAIRWADRKSPKRAQANTACEYRQKAMAEM